MIFRAVQLDVLFMLHYCGVITCHFCSLRILSLHICSFLKCVLPKIIYSGMIYADEIHTSKIYLFVWFFFLHFIYFIRLAISKVSNIKTLKPGKLAILGTRSIHCLCTIFISYLLYHWCGVENKSIKLNWFELIKNKFISVFVLWEGGDCPYLKKRC